MKKPSVRDVARAAGVSISSVSRVLNGGTAVSPGIAARVRKAVAGLGYRPDARARGLRMGVSKSIGCMVPDINNPLYAAYVSAIEARLQEEGYMLLLGSSRGQLDRERELLSLFESRGMDGIIAATVSEGEDATHALFSGCSVPLVIVDRDAGPDYDAVLLDHRPGLRQAVEYLFSLGHDRIALLTPGTGIRPGKERIAGYEEAFQTAGRKLDRRLVVGVDPKANSTFDDMRRLLARSEPPTAVIGLSTQVLGGAIQAINESRLRIPADISVVGIGTSQSLAFSNPPLTHLRIDVDGNAGVAVELLLQRLKTRGSPARQVTRPLELVVRESCAKVARQKGKRRP
jgi:LacI family transcriptional regulator